MITFTFAAVPREGGAMVRMYLTQRDLAGETPRENRADWQAIRDLTETKAGEEDNAAGERRLSLSKEERNETHIGTTLIGNGKRGENGEGGGGMRRCPFQDEDCDWHNTRENGVTYCGNDGGCEKGWDKDETLSYWRRVRKYYIQNTTKKGN